MNLFDVPHPLPSEELFERIIRTEDMLIERIISAGQVSPTGFWYEQALDEWVVLLQGKAVISWDNGRSQELSAGDWLLIPAGKKHRIDYTSEHPPCIWLAVHAAMG